MVSDELIGIAGVFVLTFCLIALYHFIGMFGRHRKTDNVQVKQIRISHHDRSSDHVLDKFTGKDDAWLFWSSDLDGPPRSGFQGRNKGL